jgi:hypothetical protein
MDSSKPHENNENNENSENSENEEFSVYFYSNDQKIKHQYLGTFYTWEEAEEYCKAIENRDFAFFKDNQIMIPKLKTDQSNQILPIFEFEGNCIVTEGAPEKYYIVKKPHCIIL